MRAINLLAPPCKMIRTIPFMPLHSMSAGSCREGGLGAQGKAQHHAQAAGCGGGCSRGAEGGGGPSAPERGGGGHHKCGRTHGQQHLQARDCSGPAG
eukprot:1157447-Pelagomonas_calceolata.AAC.1